MGSLTEWTWTYLKGKQWYKVPCGAIPFEKLANKVERGCIPTQKNLNMAYETQLQHNIGESFSTRKMFYK